MKPEHASLLQQAEQTQQRMMEELDEAIPSELAYRQFSAGVNEISKIFLEDAAPGTAHVLLLGLSIYTMHRYRKFADADVD